jgi:hypothetical protein
VLVHGGGRGADQERALTSLKLATLAFQQRLTLGDTAVETARIKSEIDQPGLAGAASVAGGGVPRVRHAPG